MCSQQSITQSVERANPHAVDVDGKHARQTRLHLFRRLVGKSHRQDAVGVSLPRADEIGDARGEHARLATSRPGQDQRGSGGQFDGGTLFGIETLQQFHRIFQKKRGIKPSLIPRSVIALILTSFSSRSCRA